jgi:hypothetical protein
MISITLEPFTRNSKSCIAIKFPYNFEAKEYIKKLSLQDIGNKKLAIS